MMADHDKCWIPTRHALPRVRGRVGVNLGSFRVDSGRSGVRLGPTWGQLWVDLGYISGQCGVDLVSSRGRCGVEVESM